MCNLTSPLSPIKSPTFSEKKQSRLKRKLNDLNSHPQKDSVFSSSPNLTLLSQSDIGQIAAIPVDVHSSNYLDPVITKKLKTIDDSNFDAINESVSCKSFNSGLVKDNIGNESPFSENKLLDTCSNLPDGSSSSESWKIHKVDISPKSQMDSTAVATLSKLEKKNYSNSLQIEQADNCADGVESGSLLYTSLCNCKTADESGNTVSGTDLAKNLTAPIPSIDLMEVSSELLSSDRWEIDTAVGSPGSCHDALADEVSESPHTLGQESTSLLTKDETDDLSLIIEDFSTECEIPMVVTDKERSVTQESAFSHFENLNTTKESLAVLEKPFSESGKRNLKQLPVACHEMPQQVNSSLPLLKQSNFSQPMLHSNKLRINPYLSQIQNCADIQTSSKSKQNMIKSSRLDQSKKIDFSTPYLKSISKIEKILLRRKNAKSNISILKPKWMTKSKNVNVPVVNNASPSNIELKMEVNDQFFPGVSIIKSKIENVEVSKNSSFEDLTDIAEEEIRTSSVLSDSCNSLSERKCYNYVRRKWERPVRKNLSKSVPKVVADCFKSLKYSFNRHRSYTIERTKLLTEAFKDEFISPEIDSIVFYVLKYFSLLERYYHNPVWDFKKQQDTSVFLSPFEEQIVSILLDLENLEERFKDLTLSVVVNVCQLILALSKLNLHGYCALCRLYTLICKSKANKREAISLCCDILKIKHRLGPMLIATIVGVWNDLFDTPYDVAEDEAVFYGSLCIRAQQLGGADSKSNGLSVSDWETSKLLVEKYMPATAIRPSEDIVDFLVESIKGKCIKETYAKEYLFTTPLVLFAAYCGWQWVKVNIIDKYLVPYIGNCVDSAKNSRDLTLFCKIYAEICLFYPINSEPEKVLYELFEAGKEDNETKFMQDAAAPALVQLLLSRNIPLPEDVSNWYKENESNPSYTFLKYYFHRQSLSVKTDFTEADIL